MAMHRLPVHPGWVKVLKRLTSEQVQRDQVVVTGAGSRISLEACRRAVEEILAWPRPDRPTAVFAVNDAMADVFVRLVRERGLRVPQDISVAGFADANRSEPDPYSWLTSYAQPTYKIGREAARLLMRRIEDPAACTTSVLLQGELMPGVSTAAPSAGTTD